MSGENVHPKVAQGQQLTPIGILFTILGLLVFDGALQYLFLVIGAAVCLGAVVLILQGKKEMETTTES